MTPNSNMNVPDSIRTAIQTSHPGIAVEIRGAINTLRKLQAIAGPMGSDGSVILDTDATVDGLTVAPNANGNGDQSLQTVDLDDPSSVPQVPVLSVGDTFGRYQIVRLLGRGAMGAVYLAYDGQLQRHVALKTPSLGGNSHSIARFFQEARAAAQIRSAYTCPIHDVGQIGGTHYITMAFIDGEPLSRMLAQQRMQDQRAIAELTKKIAHGLHESHKLGIIHRDLKPDNIMIEASGDPIIVDFGLARHLDDDVRLTTPGGLIGTPAYMSPEQIDSNPNGVGPTSDIYSLGVVVYEMLTGQLPFRGSLTSILRQIAGDQPPPRPSSVNAALGENSPLEGICLRMMARSPAERYSSMAAVIEAVEEAFFRVSAPSVAPSLGQRLASWFGKRQGKNNTKAK
jgi:serine/threonine protein kinase